MIDYSVFFWAFELIDDRSQTVACTLPAILVIHVLKCSLEKSVVGDVVEYICVIVQTNPGLKCGQYVLSVDLSVLKSFNTTLVKKLEDVELLCVQSLPGCVSLGLIHDKLGIVDLSGNILECFEVDVE